MTRIAWAIALFVLFPSGAFAICLGTQCPPSNGPSAYAIEQGRQTRALQGIERELREQNEQAAADRMRDSMRANEDAHSRFMESIPAPSTPLIPWLLDQLSPPKPKMPSKAEQDRAAKVWLINYLAVNMKRLTANERRAACRIAFPQAVQEDLVQPELLPIFINGCPTVDEEARDPRVFERYAQERR